MDMTLAELAAKTGLAKPATEKQIASFVKKIGFPPPEDYLVYLRLTNGNHSSGTFPLELHCIKDALAYTKDYEFAAAGPLVIIGTDGGGNAICLDGRYQPARIIQTEYSDRGGTSTSIDFGTSFAGFLRGIIDAPEEKVWPPGLPPFSVADGIVRRLTTETDWSCHPNKEYPELTQYEWVHPQGFSADGTLMIGSYKVRNETSSAPSEIRLGLYEYPSGKLIRWMPFGRGDVHGRIPRIDPQRFLWRVESREDRPVWKILDMATFELGPEIECALLGGFDPLTFASGKGALCFSPSGKWASKPEQGPLDLHLVDPNTGVELRRFQTATSCFTLHGGIIYQSNCTDNRITAQDFDSGKQLWETTLSPRVDAYYHFKMSPDGQTLLIHECDDRHYGLRTRDGKKLFRSKASFDAYYDWDWLPNSRYWVGARVNGRQVGIFDGISGELVLKCPHATQRCSVMALPNGRDILINYFEGPHIWTLPPKLLERAAK